MESHLLGDGAGDDDTCDKAVDGQDLGHDGAETEGPTRIKLACCRLASHLRHNVRILHQALGTHHATGEDGAGGFGSAIGRADGGEDDGACAAESTEEGLKGSC